MAKGSVRKKGKKWYYRFYIEDESGNRVQKEYPGTESKSETEALLRRAMEDYEEKLLVRFTLDGGCQFVQIGRYVLLNIHLAQGFGVILLFIG